MNFYPFNDIETISPRPLLFITGDQAHSKEFSKMHINVRLNRKNCIMLPVQAT